MLPRLGAHALGERGAPGEAPAIPETLARAAPLAVRRISREEVHGHRPASSSPSPESAIGSGL
jgi:hypothetical protein